MNLVAADVAEALFDVKARPSATCGGDVHEADRFFRRAAVRTGDAAFADGLGAAPAAPAAKPAEQPAEALGGSPAASRPGWGPMGYSAATVTNEAAGGAD